LPVDASSRRPALVCVLWALATAAAAWLSQGLLVDSGGGADRIALLPLSAASALICLVAAALAFRAVRRGRSLAPFALLLLVVIPWFPFVVLPMLRLWSGPLTLVVWIAWAAAMLSPRVLHVPWVVRSGPRTAAALALTVGMIAWWQVAPQVPAGDEWHYLIIAQSLLRDGDLRIENNHRDRDYRHYFSGDLPPDFRVRGRNGQIYSIHAPGLPALIAPAFLLAGYRGAVLLLLALSALCSALMWHLAWMVTRRRDAAWFGWATVTLSSTWIFHSFTVFPDGPGSLFALTGVWALLRLEQEAPESRESVRPWFWHGAALAVLPWMHTRFATLAGCLGALILLRMSRVPNAAAKALAFLAVPSVSFLGWIAYFIAIYGTADPSVPYGGEEGSVRFVLDGLGGLLFDQRFGLFAYAPVLIVSFIGVGIMLRRRVWRRYAAEQLFVIVPYLIVVTSVAMWWGGHSAPARFFTPVLPWMAIPAAAAWTAMERRATRGTAAAALVLTAFASVVLVFADNGSLAYNVRDRPAQWLGWLNVTTNLAAALPAWHRDTQMPLVRGVGIWGTAALMSWLLLRLLEERRIVQRREHMIVAGGIIFAAAASSSAAIAWAIEGVPGGTPTASQLEALRRLSGSAPLVALRIPSFTPVGSEAVLTTLRMEPLRATTPGGAGRDDRPLYDLPEIPAGEYHLRLTVSRPEGWLMIGIGSDQFAIQTTSLAEAQAGLTVRFPVAVHALIVRGDEDARRHVRGIQIQPAHLIPPAELIARGYARHAVRYGQTTTFFMDDQSYPEPEAFWVRGETETEIVVQPDAGRDTQQFLLRNGAAENTVRITTGESQRELQLQPGEENRLTLPLAAGAASIVMRFATSAGFVPSAVDPDSRDNRYLGLWVKLGG
jgi:hypothetical protein